MGPSETQQASGLQRTEKEELGPIISGCFLPENSGYNLDPLESTHIDGSFQAGWTEPFEFLTSTEERYQDYGEAESSKKISLCRAQSSRRSSFDVSSVDPEVVPSSESLEKLTFLEDRILELEGENSQLEESEHKLRQTNKDLVKRIHALEEQLQEEKLLREEERREHLALRESSFQKAERKWSLDMEKLHTLLKALQEENSQLSLMVSTLHGENKVLEKKVQSLVTEVLQVSESRGKEHDKSRELEESLARERVDWELRWQDSAQLIEDLRIELASLGGRAGEARCSRENCCAQTLWEECNREKQRLAEENRSLRHLNEELQDTLLLQSGSLCFHQDDYTGNSPGTQESPIHSIADEIEMCTRDQMSALNEQKEINRRLHQYLDRVILIVLEKAPSLLEIKPSS